MWVCVCLYMFVCVHVSVRARVHPSVCIKLASIFGVHVLCVCHVIETESVNLRNPKTSL